KAGTSPALRAPSPMPQLHANSSARPYQAAQGPFVDHVVERARNRLHREPEPARVIEIGEVTAGIAVPEQGGVRFFSSQRHFDPLDGTVFASVEQAAKAARARFRERTQSNPPRRQAGHLQVV